MALSKCTDRKCSLSGMYDERRRKKKRGLAGNCVFVGVCAIVLSEYKHTDIRSVGKMMFQGGDVPGSHCHF